MTRVPAPTAAPRPMGIGDIFTMLKDAALAFGQDKAPRLSAAIAFYAMLSLSPLLVLAVALLGRFLTDPSTLQGLFGPNGTVTQALGPQAATTLQGLIPKGDALNKGTLIASLVGFVTLFLGATGLFVQLQDTLNSMWGADPPPKQTLAQMVKTRAVAFLMILFIGAILITFLGVNTYLSSIASDLGDRFGAGAFFVRLVSLLVSTLFLTPVFAFIFKFLPTIKLEWRETWVGAAVTALLFSVGQVLISIYLGRTAPGSAFGASAALFALLVWIYYSGMIFFFGAEVTWVYSQKYGSHAGGAANVAKKQALAQRGAQLPTEPSEQERRAASQADEPVRDSRGRVLGLPVPRLPTRQERRERARARAANPSLLPSLGGAVWNLLSAALAIPSLLILKLVGLNGRKR